MSPSPDHNEKKAEENGVKNESTREEYGNTSSLILESKLRTLREESSNLSQALTQKLATSQSGQNLLHIGPALSTLPPDLQSLLSNLEPYLSEIKEYEEATLEELKRIVDCGYQIRIQTRRVQNASACRELYEDLVASERDIEKDGKLRVEDQLKMVDKYDTEKDGEQPYRGDNLETEYFDDLDHIASLERSAYTTLQLIHELKSSSEVMSESIDSSNNAQNSYPSTESCEIPSMNTPLPKDKEKAQFLMKLAPRIRRLESETVKALTARLDMILTSMLMKSKKKYTNGTKSETLDDPEHLGNLYESERLEMQVQKDNLMIGHCLRGLAILGRGQQAESTFARVACMPIIRSKVSLGRLDEGGARGECSGLFPLLEDIACSITDVYGEVLTMSEGIFSMDEFKANGTGKTLKSEIDLVTAGVWVPISTALMSDPTIKTAIFSPGIANILQANYIAVDTFLSELASKLLMHGRKQNGNSLNVPSGAGKISIDDNTFASLYFNPKLTKRVIHNCQSRIYRHSVTKNFFKKWNLPIYYQLRFGEVCNRFNRALTDVQKDGWDANVFTASDLQINNFLTEKDFSLPCFKELYDIILWFWRPNVFLKPLTHRFLRATIQIIGRMTNFIEDGINGNIKFGSVENIEQDDSMDDDNDDAGEHPSKAITIDNTYCWSERIDDVAAVSWNLSLIEQSLSHHYLDSVMDTLAPKSVSEKDSLQMTEEEVAEVHSLACEILNESSQEIIPIVEKCWNEIIVGILITKCSAPLSAVRGVAATYRMTNRPPPTMASPFVSTILRPLKEFDESVYGKVPSQIGEDWKQIVITAVAEKYSTAVEELINTVQRTEEALKNRKARRSAAGGMSDGEKVKLQLFLDYREFRKNIDTVGTDADSIQGVTKLSQLTKSGESLFLQNQPV